MDEAIKRNGKHGGHLPHLT